MFRDIVSNLSLSPASSTHLAYYWRRLKREQLTRQLSIFMALALVLLQGAMIVAPPDAANASGSANDLICGGLGTLHPQHSLMDIYNNDVDNCGHGGYHQLFAAFGISKADLEHATDGTVTVYDTRTHSYNKDIKSVGRQDLLSQDYAFKAGGATTYYLRPLYLVTHEATMGAVMGQNDQGKWFAVLDLCGNIAVTDITPGSQAPVVVGQSAQPITGSTTAPVVGSNATPAPPPQNNTSSSTPAPPPENNTPPGNNTPPPTPVPGSPNITIAKSAIDIPAAAGPSRNADGTTAQPGDTIQYTLTTDNTGTASRTGYVVSDDISDILEYSTITDTGGGTLTNGVISWKPVTIAAGGSQANIFQVKIMNPLPLTPSPASNPLAYDFKMQNVYGNQVTINLPLPVPSQVKAASAQLPQTGPGTDSLIVLVLVGGIAYFYFRNRQLITEIGMLRGDHYGEGGSS